MQTNKMIFLRVNKKLNYFKFESACDCINNFEYLVQCQSDCTSTVLKCLNIHDHLKKCAYTKIFFLFWTRFHGAISIVCGSNRTMSGA